MDVNVPRTLEGMGQNGYEKSDRGDGSPRLPEIKSGMNMVKGFRAPSGNLNNSDVIFSPEDIIKENSVQKMNLNEQPVFIQGNHTEFVEGLENFGADMNK